MHISEGILSQPILYGGAALTVAGVIIGLRKINSDNLPKVAVMAATFFVASFIHLTIGPSTVHLMLNGLIGLMLGWAAFPVVLVGLLLQAILFQFGGLSTLGINTFNVAAPGILMGLALNKMVLSDSYLRSSIGAFLTGFLSLGLTAILLCGSLYLTNPVQYTPSIYVILIAHLAVMPLEGLIALVCVVFLKKVKPELLHDPLNLKTSQHYSEPLTPSTNEVN